MALLLLHGAMGAPIESAALASESPLAGLTRNLVELYQHAETGDLSREAEFHATVAKLKEAHQAYSESEHGRQLLGKSKPLSEPSGCYEKSWQKSSANAGDDCTVWCTTYKKVKDVDIQLLATEVGSSATPEEIKKSSQCNSMDFDARAGDMTVLCLGKDACNSVELNCKASSAECFIYCNYGKPACNSLSLKDKSDVGPPSVIMYAKKKNINSVKTKGAGATMIKAVLSG